MHRSLQQDQVLDHYKHPRNFGELENAEHAHAANPLCGDELDFYLAFDDHNNVADVKFNGRGCTITMASASMLSEKLKGMTKPQIAALTNDDVIHLLGVEVNPARLKCATLSLEAVQQAIGHH